MTDGGGELTRPSAERVARRALTLAAVVCRCGIEGQAANPAAEALRESVLYWVGEIGVAPEMEDEEMELLRTPVGKLSTRQRVQGAWRGEGLAVLVWALGRCELPPYDVPAVPYEIAQAIGFREPAQDTVLAGPRLRSNGELNALADDLFSVHWRLREYSLAGKAIDFVAVAKEAWFGSRPISNLRLADGDLEIRGVPISSAPEPAWREVMSIARERQQAANWLIGLESLYSNVRSDT